MWQCRSKPCFNFSQNTNRSLCDVGRSWTIYRTMLTEWRTAGNKSGCFSNTWRSPSAVYGCCYFHCISNLAVASAARFATCFKYSCSFICIMCFRQSEKGCSLSAETGFPAKNLSNLGTTYISDFRKHTSAVDAWTVARNAWRHRLISLL